MALALGSGSAVCTSRQLLQVLQNLDENGVKLHSSRILHDKFFPGRLFFCSFELNSPGVILELQIN